MEDVRIKEEQGKSFSWRSLVIERSHPHRRQAGGHQSAAPAHNSKQESTGHRSLVKHPQHSPADVEGPQSPQEIEAVLALLVEGISVLRCFCSHHVYMLPTTAFSILTLADTSNVIIRKPLEIAGLCLVAEVYLV
ncbi:unnamed protein product [Pleuronectes platessa]|uniref:Uncharacterized protein n=1 Tax=Pleuronectes platessa TaxID=8262 RepID=A0A9N7YQT9_PLEPL|nr:unnamed protein product [Pleuronectes platessa]